MNILPFLSSLLIGGSVAFTHSCNAFIEPATVEINSESGAKYVRLMKIDPARVDSVKMQSFFGASEKDYRNGIVSFGKSSGAVELGMAGVPVLDQGQYGTCVTFSTTAALDARLGKSDFISQQCSLALDLGMGNNYWEGAYYPSEILIPLQTYGVVSKAGCPTQYPDDSYTLSSENYKLLSDKEASAAVAQVKYQYSPKSNLVSLKAAVKAGHRVLIAFLIDAVSQEAVQGFNIKVDGRGYVGGLWACKQGASQKYCVKSNAGHEVLVTGYDDKQQLLKIRNSWSEQVGDQGDYYMTYTFFNSMSVDMTVVY